MERDGAQELTVQDRLLALQDMSVGELRREWQKVLGEAPRSYHRRWLCKRLAWAIQAREFGGLSEMAKRRIGKLQTAAEPWMPLGRASGNPSTSRYGRDLAPSLSRSYKGQTLTVIVREDGFEFEGKTYRSLTAIAKTVTGSHVSGPRFFGTRRKRSF